MLERKSKSSSAPSLVLSSNRASEHIHMAESLPTLNASQPKRYNQKQFKSGQVSLARFHSTVTFFSYLSLILDSEPKFMKSPLYLPTLQYRKLKGSVF